MKLILKFTVASILVWSVVLIIGFIFLRPLPPPKHSELVSQFTQHRAAYEELASMIREDKLEGIFRYGKLYESNVDLGDYKHMSIEVKRAKKYSHLMKLIEAPSISLNESQRVRLSIDSFGGWLNEGWRIGFVKSEL